MHEELFQLALGLGQLAWAKILPKIMKRYTWCWLPLPWKWVCSSVVASCSFLGAEKAIRAASIQRIAPDISGDPDIFVSGSIARPAKHKCQVSLLCLLASILRQYWESQDCTNHIPTNMQQTSVHQKVVSWLPQTNVACGGCGVLTCLQ